MINKSNYLKLALFLTGSSVILVIFVLTVGGVGEKNNFQFSILQQVQDGELVESIFNFQLSQKVLAAPAPEDLSNIKDKIAQKQEEIRKLEEEARKYQETIKQKQSEARTLKNKIAINEAEIAELDVEIRLTQTKIEEAYLTIQTLSQEIENQEADLEKQKSRLAEIIRNIHEYDETDLLELIFETQNFSEIFNQIGYIETLQGEIQEKVRQVKEIKQKLEEERGEMEKERSRQEDLESQLSAQREIEVKQRQDYQWLLSRTRRSEEQYQRLLRETEAKERQVNQEIFELEEALKRVLDPSKIPTARPGILLWPTEGLLTQGYGCLETRFARSVYPSCNNGRGGFHNGIDIAASRGTPIFAARDGKVIAAGNAPYAYGNWVAVEHDNGLVTLYTHLSIKKVSVGDNVIGGKSIIGYMGSTGFSTGPHLHFIVYAPGTFRTEPSRLSGILPIGATLNPLDYL